MIGMGSLGVRSAVVAAAAGVAALTVVVTAASGAASADATFSTLPGLETTTYGEVAAYSARIENTGDVTLKNVTLRNPIPSTEIGGVPQPATFQSASCDGAVSGGVFSCIAASQLHPGESVAVTIAWETPTGGSSPGCASTTPCLVAHASWQSGSRTLEMSPAETALLSPDDPSRAATYALEACTDPSSPTLETDPDVSVSNPLATSVCAPSLPAGAPGLVSSIEEAEAPPADPGITQASNICLPSPGTECDADSFVFSPLATFTFVVANASLPAGEEIDTVYHDGVVVSTARDADPRVVRIKNERFKGRTTIVVRSSTNGRWTFG